MALDYNIFFKPVEMQQERDLALQKNIFDMVSGIGKRRSGADLPATIQVANEVEKALKEGDIDRANRIMQVHKTFDRGILPYSESDLFRKIAGTDTLRGTDFVPQNNKLRTGEITPELMNQPITPNKIGPVPLSVNDLPEEVRTDPLKITVRPERSRVGVMPGYAEAVGSIEAGKKGMARQAEKNVDLVMDPKIKRLVQDQTNESDLDYKPRIEYETNRRGETGKKMGESEALLNSVEARMPQLEDTIQRLSALGQTATYTGLGRVEDTLQREAGLDVGTDATARAEYISMVDNEVLPLLRETFGAQFTQKEGDSLKVTLGDPNKSPEEKDAVLRSFIRTKMESANTLAREVGQDQPYTGGDVQSAQGSIGKPDDDPYYVGDALPELPKDARSEFAEPPKRSGGEAKFYLKKQGFTDDQIQEYLKARGIE